MRYIFPWIKINACEYFRRDVVSDELIAWCYQQASLEFGYRIYNRDNSASVIAEEKYGFATFKEAKKACDNKLAELGYELISKKRAERLGLLV